MTTLTHSRDLRITPAIRKPRRASQARVIASGTVSRDGWLDRLGAWADRQPVHHRMGCWVGFR